MERKRWSSKLDLPNGKVEIKMIFGWNEMENQKGKMKLKVGFTMRTKWKNWELKWGDFDEIKEKLEWKIKIKTARWETTTEKFKDKD